MHKRREEGPRSAKNVTVGEIIGGTVVTAQPTMPLSLLLEVLAGQGLNALPVVERDGQLVGIVSKSDVVRELAEQFGAAVGFEQHATVRDVMAPVVTAVREVASVAHVAAIMAYGGLHRAPVLDGDGRLVGIVSLVDIARWLARQHGYTRYPEGWAEVRLENLERQTSC